MTLLKFESSLANIILKIEKHARLSITRRLVKVPDDSTLVTETVEEPIKLVAGFEKIFVRKTREFMTKMRIEMCY